MIRALEPRDFDWLCKLTHKFNDELYDVPLNEQKLENTLIQFCHPECIKHIGYRSDKGAIIGIVTEDPLRDWTVMVELGWYANDRSGIRLLDHLEQAARDVQCDEVRMTTLERNPRVADLLKRRGYTPIETSHRLLL